MNIFSAIRHEISKNIRNKRFVRFVKDINICSDLETTIITIQDMNGKESRYKLKAGTEIKLNVNVGETTMTFTGIELKD